MEQYTEFINTLKASRALRFDRNINTNARVKTREMHTFSDASGSGYGSVVYLREVSEDNKVRIHVVASKARVTPLKTDFSIHRLELLGAVVAARLADRIRKYLNCHIDKFFYWTDNSPTLHWIRDDPDRWKAFVSNRIREIQSVSSPSDWRYVVSAENPADLLSRGKSLEDPVASSAWLTGPSWLSESGSPREKHQLHEFFEEREKVETERRHAIYLTTSDHSREPFLDGSRLSSWIILVNSTARVMRWFANHRDPGNRTPLRDPVSSTEAFRATEKIIGAIQAEQFGSELKSKCADIPKESRLSKLSPFVDESGLLRCRSRLERSKELSYDEKFPILLLGDIHSVRLLIRFIHERRCFHIGGIAATLNQLRSRFYILSARRAVKSVLRSCKVCMKFRVEAAMEPVPPLPDFRLETAPAFTICGADFAGPVLYRSENNERRKSYILLFVCAATRAVHLELVPDLTTQEFLLSLKKFLNRFTHVAKIISDNGLTFVRAAKELKIMYGHAKAPSVKQHLSNSEIIWEFITPLAPQMGGWWERMVQTVKRPLRRILGKSSLSFRELESVLLDIERVVNQRPLHRSKSIPTRSVRCVRLICCTDIDRRFRYQKWTLGERIPRTRSRSSSRSVGSTRVRS